MTDNWQYFHGSRYDYLRWLGLSMDDDGALFYTDPDARAAYQRFVRQLLQHRNPYTGLRYVDDPTIMAWELGNELNGMTPSGCRPTRRTSSGWPRGSWWPRASSSASTRPCWRRDDVDISDSHYYPPTADGISADAKTVTDAGKVYIAGEFGSRVRTEELLTPWPPTRRQRGDLLVAVPARRSLRVCQHDDGFTLHHPVTTKGCRITSPRSTGSRDDERQEDRPGGR